MTILNNTEREIVRELAEEYSTNVHEDFKCLIKAYAVYCEMRVSPKEDRTLRIIKRMSKLWKIEEEKMFKFVRDNFSRELREARYDLKNKILWGSAEWCD